jgi:transposase-like protein
MPHNSGMDEPTLPQTLREAILYFSDPDVCVSFVAELRWPDGPVCPRCAGREHSYIATRRLWRCKSCKREFTVKLGTIFEDSPLPLEKWLPAVWLIANSKNGISSYEVGRGLGVSQKSAWFMLHRIRLAMQTGSFEQASGHVEVDETFIGGKARNMHVRARREKITGTGGKDKVAVVGVLTRGGRIQTQIIPNRRRPTLQAFVREHVAPGSNIYTDALGSYVGLDGDYTHEVVDHAREYVDGMVHTNGIENFWSLLKRGLKGTYVSVEPFHLFRYLDERAFAFNERGKRDLGRFMLVLGQAVGRRVTWDELTGKALQASGEAAV